MSSVVSETWWLDTSGLPDLFWARLRVFADGMAEVLDLDGRYHQFANLNEARSFLEDDEYEAVEAIDPSDFAQHGWPPGVPAPPSASTDAELVPQMLVRAAGLDAEVISRRE